MIPMSESPLEPPASQGENTPPKGDPIHRLTHALARLGLGDVAMRFGTNFLSMLVIFSVIWFMQYLFRDTVSGIDPETQAGSTQVVEAGILLPKAFSASIEGIGRRAELHTSIPSRPRIDVIDYTVQVGDSIFGIAEKYNLKPTTILFSNAFLADNANLLQPGQVLKILPVDGAYYEWVGAGAETLTGISDYFGIDPETIVTFPGNHLDPDAIGDYAEASFAAGTWLIIPGGSRPFTSWTAPAQMVVDNPDVRVWGVGVCTGISLVQVGYGTFVFPTVEHWLSGTDYRPDVNHFAVDFGGSLGNAIYAVDAGTVVYAGWNDWGYGYMVMLDHGNGWQSLYAHLSQVNVGCGQNVGQGDLIALMGSTGNSTGPHLHFELRYNGAFVDPHTIYAIGSR